MPTTIPSSSSPNPSVRTALSALAELMRGFRLRYAMAIGAILLATSFNFMVPLLSGFLIDFALAGDTTGSRIASLFGPYADSDWLRAHLWVGTLAIIGLTLCAGVFNFFKGRWAAQASDGIARNLKDRLYDHLHKLPTAYHDRADTGDTVQRATSDVETVRLALASQVVEVSNALILLLVAFPLMLFMDLRMSMVSILLLPPIMLFGAIFFRSVRRTFQKVDEAEGKVTSVIQENLTGLRVVRAFARQDFEIEKFSRPNAEYRDLRVHLIRLMALYWSASDLISLLQNALVIGFGLHFIAAGTLSVGSFFTFLMLLNLVLWPVRQLGRTLTDLGKAIVAITRIREILDVPEESFEVFIPDRPVRGALCVRDLRFAHSDGPAALQGISFSVEPGQTLAILGPSGAGKSTLMHLLLRLYEPDAGSIALDGMPLASLNRQWLRSQFATVLQEPFLFSKSIVENIRLGVPDADPATVERAARMAHIHEAIDAFPQGYQTLVGERGVTLSGGQRQRVAIARALAREDAPVLLLDDALSAVDSATEEAILNALEARRGRSTTLVIAHRLSTLTRADLIIVLDNGRIVQRGTHTQLSAEPGLYQRLWNRQHASIDDLLPKAF